MTPFPSPDEAAMGDFDPEMWDDDHRDPLADTQELIHEVTGEGEHDWRLTPSRWMGQWAMLWN